MNTPFSYLCGMQCIVGEQYCPAFDVCPVNGMKHDIKIRQGSGMSYASSYGAKRYQIIYEQYVSDKQTTKKEQEKE